MHIYFTPLSLGQKALPPRSVDVSAVYLLSFPLLMTANNKPVKGKWLKSLRLECARGLPLPLFTEMPRRLVFSETQPLR